MFKFFFKIVDTYEQHDYLIVIADTTDSGDYRNGEVVELHAPDGKCFTLKSHEVLFDPPNERPFCLGFQGLKKADIPVGSEVWLSEQRPERKPSRYYEENPKTEKRHTA